jgi:LysR family transcriptional regulator, glycine cleavage system transcriptional activator
LAAEELGVTPGAVSRQIKVLEDFLGLLLFYRSGREVILTPVGKEYLLEVAEGFGRIRSATTNIVGVPEDAPLRVSTSATFTLRWLMPRMMSFYSKHADSNLQLTMNLAPVDFQRDDLDATIKMGQEDTPHAVVRKILSVHLIPVCSPKLIESVGAIEVPHDFNRCTLLHSTARSEIWQHWLEAVGAPEVTGASSMHFDSSSLAYQAALDSVGIAMAQLPLVIEDLRSGRLVAPIAKLVKDSRDYNLIWPDRTPRNRHFQPFRDWIISEARKTTQEIEGLLANIEAGGGLFA